MGGKGSKAAPTPQGVDKEALDKGNSHYGKRKQLYCRTGYFLAIMEDGEVIGVDQDMHPNAVVEYTTVNAGEVRIRATKANLYLAMNKDGKLYGEVSPWEDSTVFYEKVHRQYLTYLSKRYSHMNWFVAIKKSGKAKNGKKTKLRQKAIQFLPVRLAEDR